MNKRSLKRNRLKTNSLTVPVKHLPEELFQKRIICNSCSNIFAPDWFKPHREPLSPVKPKYETYGVPYEGPGRWILQSLYHKCPRCQKDVMLDVPVNKLTTKGQLYGDEADRHYGKKLLFTYSLVGGDCKSA